MTTRFSPTNEQLPCSFVVKNVHGSFELTRFLPFIHDKTGVDPLYNYVLSQQDKTSYFGICRSADDQKTVIDNLDGEIWNSRRLNVLPFKIKTQALPSSNGNAKKFEPTTEQIDKTILVRNIFPPFNFVEFRDLVEEPLVSFLTSNFLVV